MKPFTDPMPWLATLVGAGLLAMTSTSTAVAQTRPYIGFVYPAGGQRGTTFQVKVGGQGLENPNAVLFTGKGVTARVVDWYRRLGNQEMTLLNEQLRELKRDQSAVATTMMSSDTPMTTSDAAVPMMSVEDGKAGTPSKASDDPDATRKLIARMEKRVAEHCDRPASVSLAGLVFLEVRVAPDAPPGEREVRLATPTGVSNPMVFHIGQQPEFTRKPMVTSTYQVLGKEAGALRKRPDSEIEARVAVPCTMNGQIASGEVNRYRFEARKGQRLVIATQARRLIPYIADAVPGWFQPVLALYDANGKEVAYADDYRFSPDPAILFEVPKDADYVLAIHDSIYRGREDFVYRVSIGEAPFLTSIFPLGCRVGETPAIKMEGWNLGVGELTPPPQDAAAGIYRLVARRAGWVSNPVLFALDTLPECLDTEPNNVLRLAQKVSLPAIVNGRIDQPGDWDVFQFAGRTGETLVAEIRARRLDSPLDSVIKLTDAAGRVLAVNDDREDPGSGLNTHHADSYLMARLPADGLYCVQVGDTAHNGGTEFAYRLRLSPPQPDFELRAVPSSVSFRSKATSSISVRCIRKDGFSDPIKLTLLNPPAGFSASPVYLSGTQEVARLAVKTSLSSQEPVPLTVVGSAKIQGREVVREAVPAEDRMQAFLWRHLVPAEGLVAMVIKPADDPTPRRFARARPGPAPSPATMTTNSPNSTNTTAAATNRTDKPKFTRQQVAGRLRELKRLFDEGFLTDEFYEEKVAECEAAR